MPGTRLTKTSPSKFAGIVSGLAYREIGQGGPLRHYAADDQRDTKINGRVFATHPFISNQTTNQTKRSTSETVTAFRCRRTCRRLKSPPNAIAAKPATKFPASGTTTPFPIDWRKYGSLSTCSPL